MRGSTAIFTALLYATAGFTAAGLLAASPAAAQASGNVTVTVHGPSPFAPDAANPDSVLPELGGPGVSGVTVTVTDLGPGMTPLPTTGTTGNDGTVNLNLEPGVYEVIVEGNGHTGVDYITVDDDGGTETSSDFSLDGLPSTDTADGGTEAIDGLSDAANDAHDSGDDGALADAVGDLDAVSSQSQSAAESLEEIADGMMDDLPPHIRNELEDDFANAETAEEVQEAIDEAEESILEEIAGARKFAEAFGQEYHITHETLEAIDALRRLEKILNRLKNHQNQLEAAQGALKEIASAAAANNSQSSANVQQRMNMLNTLQRNSAMAARPVQPRIPQMHHPRVEPSHHGVIRLEVGPSRR